MTLPSYDPAVAANIISFVALFFAWLSYRLSRKTTDARAEASLPDVVSQISAVKDQPGWYNIHVEIKNNSSSDMTVQRVVLRKPKSARGLSSWDATKDDELGSRALREDLDAPRAKETIELGYNAGPKGTAPHPHGFRAGERQWVDFYVRAEPLSELRFELVFSWRSTDVRRSSHHVSKQSVTVPARQAD